MNKHRSGIIFSDLDGTFLDARYRPVLDAAGFAEVSARWHVVWASSRTAGELVQLQRVLDSTNDAIGENGGVLVTRSAQTAAAIGNAERFEDGWVVRLASPCDVAKTMIRAACTQNGVSYRTIDELAPHDLAGRARCAVSDARLAQQRRSSVLLCDVDRNNPSTTLALAALRAQGCAVSFGGYWISVVHGGDKGSAALAWLTSAHRDDIVAGKTVAAIGNSDNDESLLKVADRPFVIRDPFAGCLARLTSIPGAIPLDRVGTSGWLEMIERLERAGLPVQ